MTVISHKPEQVHLRREGRVAVLSFDNPNGGYLTAPLVEAIDRHTLALEQDDSVRAIILTGHHPGTFITHYSPDELSDISTVVASMSGDEEVGKLRRQSVAMTRWIYRLLRWPRLFRWCDKKSRNTSLASLFLGARINAMQSRWQQSSTIYIAAINGFAMGGGCEMSLACDFRLMAEGTGRIGLPESISGIIPGSGGTQRLSRLVGASTAISWILTGRMFSAKEAEAVGLINQAVAEDELMGMAMQLAQQMAGQPALAVQGVKRAVYHGSHLPLADGLAEEAAQFMGAVISRDAAHLGKKYLQRRDEGVPAVEIFDEFRQGDAVELSGK